MQQPSNNIVVSPDEDFLAKLKEDVPWSPEYAASQEDWREIEEEERTPLGQLHPDVFQRYLDLFYTYMLKQPFHVRKEYGRGFLRQNGRYKGNGQEYNRYCFPGLIAKMLDHDRWKTQRPEKRHCPNYWVALYSGRKSTLACIDLDNKDNLLGYYRYGHFADSPHRPLPTISLAHFQGIKRVYDAFPNRIWCVSSATQGLHIWQKMPYPQPIDTIHARIRPQLQAIGLGSTEIHPMNGRPHRRPFGQDYYTITDNGLLENWTDQLDYFENIAESPSFAAIYQSLRSLLLDEWARYELHHNGDFTVPADDSPLRKYIDSKKIANIHLLREDLKKVDHWAEQGFPETLAASEPVVIDLGTKKATTCISGSVSPDCGIALTNVCNGEWVQNCESWAINGLPCHDSIFLVVSQLARWFYLIEFWGLPEKERMEKMSALLTDYCLTKHNGFISRLQAGRGKEVKSHIGRTIHAAISQTDLQGKLWFSNVRQKRATHQYKRVIYLEPAIVSKGQPMGNNTLPLPVGFNICCSVLPSHQTAPEKRKAAKEWEYKLDDTPLPLKLEEVIKTYYQENELKIYAPMMRKGVGLLNYLWQKGGEARLGIKSLRKMGFTDHAARQHVKRLDEMGIIMIVGQYSPVEAMSRKFRLTEKAMALFKARIAKEKMA